MSEGNKIIESVVMPLVTPEQAREQWSAYQRLKASVLDAEDFQQIGKERFTKKSGFRKIATFFGLSDKITEKQRVERPDGSFMWMITVTAMAPNGRVSEGVGVCDSRERRFAHLEHDVYATAHTRAKNRAISDLVAGGEVSAEEVASEAPVYRESTVKTQVEPVGDDGSGVYDLASLNSFLLSNGVSIEYGDQVITEESDGKLIVRSPRGGNVYAEADQLLRGIGFSWVKGGLRWEREA